MGESLIDSILLPIFESRARRLLNITKSNFMNKRKLISRIGILLLCLGIFVWALFTLPAAGLIVLVIFLIAAYINYVRNGKDKVEGPNDELNMEGLIEKYGTPDDTIIANPTRGSEVGGCILVYHDKGILLINGLEVKKTEITDYVLKNDGPNPYLPADYQLHITTTLENYPLLSVSLGNEVTWAEQVMLEFKEMMQN